MEAFFNMWCVQLFRWTSCGFPLSHILKTSLYFSPPQGIEHLLFPQLLFLTMRKNLFSAVTISSLAFFEPHRPDSNFFWGLSNRRHICVTNECNFAAISLLLPAKITKVLAANSEAASHFSLLTHTPHSHSVQKSCHSGGN